MEEGTLDIQVDGEIQRVPALVADQLQLPLNCSALLGVPAIKDLGIHIDEQLKEQNSPLICHLGEKSLRRWWDHHAGESIESKPFDIANIDIYVDLPDAIHDRAKGLAAKRPWAVTCLAFSSSQSGQSCKVRVTSAFIVGQK